MRKDRNISPKGLKRKCEKPHTTEPDPLPPPIPGSAVPLTKEALRLLNRNTGENSKSLSSNMSESATTEAQGSINAYDPEYRNALEERDIYFADDKAPPHDFQNLWEAMWLPRESPELADIQAETFRAQLTDAGNESAAVKDILPQLVPLMSIQLDRNAADVKGQLWRREIALQPDLTPTLTTPKPDVTIGWKPHVFKSKFKKAYRSLQAFISPIAGFRSVAWPMFTIEANGDGDSMRVARLQNLHNGAIMLSNMFELKRKCGNEGTFFDKIHVIGVELTAESVQLSCYWSSRNSIGAIEHFGKRVQCWSLFDETGDSLREARRAIRNVIEWIRPRTLAWIQSDMADFEKANEQILLSQITPARTLASQHGINKRRSVKASTENSRFSMSQSHLSKMSKPPSKASKKKKNPIN